MGDGVKRCMPSEESTKTVARKSVVLARSKKAGEVLCEEDLTIKRPGTGIEPRFYYDVVGKELLQDMNRDHVLTWGDLK
ncbi:N,N'-diacetyllegionaminic acid synthase [compost metagenome]